MAELAAALWASRGELVFVVEEITLHVSAGEAERDEVAERFAALLLDPVSFRLRDHRA